MRTMFCPADGTLAQARNDSGDSGNTNLECANGHTFSYRFDESKDRIDELNVDKIPYSHLPVAGNIGDKTRVGSKR